MRFIRTPCYILFFIFSCIAFFVSTNQGLSIIVKATEVALPGLRIHKAKGNILHGVHLEGVSYQQEEAEFYIQSADFQLFLKGILKPKLHFAYLQVNQVKIERIRVKKEVELRNIHIKKSDGSIFFGEQWKIAFHNIIGNINKEKLSGNLQLSQDSINKVNVNLKIGTGFLNIQNKKEKYVWDVLLPDISIINKEYHGNVKVKGEYDNGFMLASIKAKNLKAEEYESKDFHLDFQLAEKFSFTLNSNKLKLKEITLDNVKVSGSGDIDNQKLNIHVNNNNDYVKLSLNGNFTDNFKGNVEKLEVFHNQEKWSLKNKPEYSLSEKEFYIQNIKLENGKKGVAGGNLLLDKEGLTSEWKLENFPTKQISFLFPQNTEIEGELSAVVKIEKKIKELIKAKGKIIVSNNQIKIDENYFQIDNTLLNFEYKNQNLTTNMNLYVNNNLIHGSAKIADLTYDKLNFEDVKKLQIKTKLNADLVDLNMISSWIPEISRINGRAQISFSAEGAIEDPTINLNGQLFGGSFTVGVLGSKAYNINLSFKQAKDSTLEVKGNGYVKKQDFQISGSLNYKDFTKSKIFVKGKALEILNARKSQLVVSPDICLTMPAIDKLFISGDLNVDSGKIDLNSIFSDFSLSDDTVFVDEEKILNIGLNVIPDLKINLQEKVYFKNTNLRGFAKGDIHLTKDKYGKNLLGDGKIEIISGEYNLMGKYFAIKQGYLSYPRNTFIQNPLLNITLEKKLKDESTVNLYVYNTLNSPKIQTSKSNTGCKELKTLDLKKETDYDTYSVIGNLLLPGDIKDNELFIDEMGIEEDENDKTIVVGKKISPNVSVEYLYKLSEGDQKGRLKADINKNLSIGTEIENQDEKIGFGVDLNFKYEIE